MAEKITASAIGVDEAIAQTRKHFRELTWPEGNCAALAQFYARLRGFDIQFPSARAFRRTHGDYIDTALAAAVDAYGIPRRESGIERGDIVLFGTSFAVCDEGPAITFWPSGFTELSPALLRALNPTVWKLPDYPRLLMAVKHP